MLGNSLHWKPLKVRKFRVKVWEFRKSMGWTQAELAAHLKCTVRTVYSLESGDFGPSPKIFRSFQNLQRRIREQRETGKLLQEAGVPVDFNED